MCDVPYLYVACIIFCLVKAPSVFVGTCCSGLACIQDVMNV